MPDLIGSWPWWYISRFRPGDDRLNQSSEAFIYLPPKRQGSKEEEKCRSNIVPRDFPSKRWRAAAVESLETLRNMTVGFILRTARWRLTVAPECAFDSGSLFSILGVVRMFIRCYRTVEILASDHCARKSIRILACLSDSLTALKLPNPTLSSQGLPIL